MKEMIQHTIPPVYNSNSKILILGTMPSPKSRETGFFYGHPQNRFWRVLATVFDSPVPETTIEKKAFLLSRGIALWDVLKSCAIEGASDSSIAEPEANDLTELLTHTQVQAVFATGKKAAELYQRFLQAKTGLPIHTLPSTSPANCRITFDALVQNYRVICRYL